MNPCVRSLVAFVALSAASLLPAYAEQDVISLKKAIETSIASDYPKLDALYKELHAHPELAFQEVKTAARLAAEMRALGFDVTENVGRTGLVAIYKNGDGPTIMVRTELDGLPMEEKTGLDYASRDKTNWNGREVFVAHSCGHDIHMASWVGTAKTPERPVARHADVHRPAGGRNRGGRQGHACGWLVHAIWQARHRPCPA